jgi:hypothetical protein
LTGAAGHDIEHALHAIQTRGDQGTIAIVGGTATIGALCARSPTTSQGFSGIAPGEDAIQSMFVSGDVQRTTQRAAVVFDAHQDANAVLARDSGAFETVDVVRDQQLMLAIEQLLQLIERAEFFGDQFIERIATDNRIHENSLLYF